MFKAIIITISSTLAVAVTLAGFFMNSILGTFGFAVTSIEKLHQLKESKRILDVVKKRHNDKKLNISKRFIKRSGKKVATSAVSAATIGTAAVAITVAGMEMHDYCDDKRELHDEENLLFGKQEEFDYSKCLAEAKNDSSKIIASVKESLPKLVSDAWASTKNISKSSWQTIKEESSHVWATTTDTTNEAWSTLLEWAPHESQ